jgi:hypothetical protein
LNVSTKWGLTQGAEGTSVGPGFTTGPFPHLSTLLCFIVEDISNVRVQTNAEEAPVHTHSPPKKQFKKKHTHTEFNTLETKFYEGIAIGSHFL